MRQLAKRIGFSLVAALLCLVGAAPAGADDGEDAEAVFAALQSAIQARDVATLERLIEPDYRFYHGLGEVDTREIFLVKVRDGRLARQRSAATEYEPTWRLFGETAIRSWIIHFRRTNPELDDWGRGTAVLIHRNGEWRLASQQTGSLFWISPAPPTADLSSYAGSYAGSSRTFDVANEQTYLRLRYADGVTAYAFPAGGDAFGMGGGLMLHFERDPEGRVARAIRRDGPRELWRAERVAAQPEA